MTFSNDPNEYCLLIIRVEDLCVLKSALKITKSASVRFGNGHYCQATDRLISEVNRVIDIFRRKEHEN